MQKITAHPEFSEGQTQLNLGRGYSERYGYEYLLPSPAPVDYPDDDENNDSGDSFPDTRIHYLPPVPI